MTIPRRTPLRRQSARRAAERPKAFSTIVAKRKPVKPRNAKRRESEFARAYHSRARVRWVKSLSCIVCGINAKVAAILGLCTKARVSDNAHTETGGMGRKAGYQTIVPLCREHHRAYDEHLHPFASEKNREWAKRKAAEVEAAWQKFGARGGSEYQDGEA